MVGAMASLSVGLMAMTATFFWIKSSIWLASRAESFCASSTTRLTFIFLAAAWAPSRRSTKNGWLSVEMDSPTVGGAAAYSGITDSNTSPPTRSNPLRIRSPSPDIFSATPRTKRSVLILSQPPVKEHSQKNDGPLDHLLVERIHIQQVQPVVDDTDDESAQQRSTDAAFPAGQRRAAQHDGRDGVQLEPHPGGRLRGVQAGGQDDRADGGQDPADHVDQRLVRGNIHAGEPRRLLVAADRIHVAPEDGLREDPIRDQGDQDHDDHRHRDPRHLAGAQPDERIREPGDRTAVSIDKGQAAADGQHAQRSDEGLDLAAGDDQTVEQSQRGADRQSRPDAHQQRAPRREQVRNDRSRDRQHRTHAQVDAAGEDDKSHAGGDNRVDGNLPRDVEQVAYRQKRPTQEREDDDEQREGDDDPEPPQGTPQARQGELSQRGQAEPVKLHVAPARPPTP